MLEGHLVVHVYEKLKGDKQCLQLSKVFTSFHLRYLVISCSSNKHSHIQCTCLCSHFLIIVHFFLILLDNSVPSELDH